jgi:hypothetical protein
MAISDGYVVPDRDFAFAIKVSTHGTSFVTNVRDALSQSQDFTSTS